MSKQANSSPGWGGQRVGAGAKPTKPRFNLAHSDDSVVSAVPPEDLPEDQRDFWARCAPMAIEKRTLTVHTVENFRLLCELDAEKRATKAVIDRDGRTFIKVTVDGSGQEHEELKAHPLTGAYARLAKQVETQLARFGLAPFGKAEAPLARKKAENPWSQVAQK